MTLALSNNLVSLPYSERLSLNSFKGLSREQQEKVVSSLDSLKKYYFQGRVFFDHIRKDYRRIARLPDEKFPLAISNLKTRKIFNKEVRKLEAFPGCIEYLKRKGLKKTPEYLKRVAKLTRVLNLLKKERIRFLHKNPFFTVEPSEFRQIPKCHFKKTLELPKENLFGKTKSLTLNEVKEVIKNLSSLKETFAWDNDIDGCYVRAHMMAEYLIAFGLEESAFEIIFLFPGSKEKMKYSYWIYHAALLVPVVIEKKVVRLIVDPSVSKTKPLSIMKWISSEIFSNQEKKKYREIFVMGKEDVKLPSKLAIFVSGYRETITISQKTFTIASYPEKSSQQFFLSIRRDLDCKQINSLGWTIS